MKKIGKLSKTFPSYIWILVVIVALLLFLYVRRKRQEGFQSATDVPTTVLNAIVVELTKKDPKIAQLYAQFQAARFAGNPAVTEQVRNALMAAINTASGNNKMSEIITQLNTSLDSLKNNPQFKSIVDNVMPLVISAAQGNKMPNIQSLVNNAKTVIDAIPRNLEQARETIDKISAKGGVFGLINSPTGQNIRNTVGISQEDIQKVKDKVGQGVGLLETGCSKMPDIDSKLAQAIIMVAKAKDVCSDIPDFVRNRSQKIRDGCALVNRGNGYIAEIHNRLGQVKQACGEIDGIKKFIG